MQQDPAPQKEGEQLLCVPRVGLTAWCVHSTVLRARGRPPKLRDPALPKERCWRGWWEQEEIPSSLDKSLPSSLQTKSVDCRHKIHFSLKCLYRKIALSWSAAFWV